MDKYIAQSINSRKEAIFNAYEVDAAKKKKITTLFSEIEKFGTQCKDVGEFETKFAQSPLNQQYLDLFTDIATSSPAKATSSTAAASTKPNIGSMVASGIAEGAVDTVATQVKNSVLPTRAAIHQKAHDELQKTPVLGDALNISQKASYAAHLGKLFGKRKKNNK